MRTLLLSLLLAAPALGQTPISQSAWKLQSVDSTQGGIFAGAASFDGSSETMWHTNFSLSPPPPYPHNIQIDLGQSYTLTGFIYTPRQDFSLNGTIANYAFYVSTDGQDWGMPISTGIWAYDHTPKMVQFSPVSGRYIKLVGLSEGSGQPYASAAEINVIGIPGTPTPFVWIMPGLGMATFPMYIPPACGPADGACSIQIQVCDTSKTPPLCMTSSQGTITLLKNITLPTPQQQSIPLVTVTP
jgi:hypothetical protein